MMLSAIRKLAIPIAVTSLVINFIIFVVAGVIWYLAFVNNWLESVTFVSHVSMLALVFTGISGIASGLAGILALVPTDDIIDKVTQ